MTVITSKENKTVQRAIKLLQKKYRYEWDEFLAEGFINVRDSVSVLAPQAIILSESAHKKYCGHFSGFEDITVTVSDALAQRLSCTENGQGVFGIFKMPPDKDCVSNYALLLDRVRDPGNIGTVLRTACACGYDVILKDCADIYNPKTVRSCMSALLKTRICAFKGIDDLKSRGYTLVAADAGGQNVFDLKRSIEKPCIIIGSEAEGIDNALAAAADITLCLPIEHIESLNAAVAAGVLMYTLKYINK